MTTDEAECHQKKTRQQEEASQDPKPPSPEKEHFRSRNRNSAGRGLSHLFSSFLKRRSQCETEGGENEEEEVKAPIADPEPELKIEGEVAHDQHSVSSAEAQAAQVKKKETEEREELEEGGKNIELNKEKAEVATLEKKEDNKDGEEKVKGKEGGSDGSSNGEEEEKATEEDSKTPRAPRRPKTMQIEVTLLDDTLYECELDKHAKGQELFTKVCDHLNLLERDYYGLVIWETPNVKTWMDLAKEIRRQVQGTNYDFTFNVKFYPPDPAQLSEDITRYYLCLQLRKDILQGRLPCSFVTLALLGSYALQSELGEYDPEVHGSEYAKEMKMANGQTKELEDKMMKLHHTYRSMSPAQADMMFLENAKKLSMYGVDLHQAKDLDGVDIMLGVCSSGLMVYKDKLRINRFPWPKVLKVSYKRSIFFIKIRPSEVEQYESAIGFKLPNYKAAKKLWKVCVEHHTFFRLTSTEMVTTPRKFLALGSKFRYSGRTQAQTKQASSLIDRPAPLFQRTSSKRNSRSMDGDNKSSRPVSAPIMSPLSPGENTPSPLLHTLHFANRSHSSTPKLHRSGDRKAEIKGHSQKTDSTKNQSPRPESTPEMKTLSRRERRRSPSVTTANGEREKKNQHSPQDKKTEMMRVRKKRAKKLEGETIYIRHSNLMLEDVDKTQTEIMRHHTSISELKRSFMESVPEPRPSEWDKRLSTNSPFRTASINGQLQPGSPVLKTQKITISDITNSLRGTIAYKDIPLVHTETKTITYESAQVSLPQPVDALAERDSGVLLSAQTITSETISTTTTTQITKTVKGGISETRIEKRIVITGDTEIDHDKVVVLHLFRLWLRLLKKQKNNTQICLSPKWSFTRKPKFPPSRQAHPLEDADMPLPPISHPFYLRASPNSTALDMKHQDYIRRTNFFMELRTLRSVIGKLCHRRVAEKKIPKKPHSSLSCST
ncbi:protein 4.1-like isoform X3 [Syngnathoides biaculeatus]|uniref:protein 4.1-like isoform X3 n=1 Tax=Syngnathoides biaculeatus TaxID=300417 RepID=UPI002ADD9D6A|nr:protein 4.1-like isoform X3 [Syngnathoides biaculeatus]